MRYVTPPRKPRSNQPSGYKGTTATSTIRSSRHDYVYYPSSWLDAATGKAYSSGYYDENGNHYDYVAIKKGNELETRASCDYCGSEIKLKWTEGALPSCPNCGAQMKEVVDNAIIEEELKQVPNYSAATPSINVGRIFAKMAMWMVICASMFVGLFTLGYLNSGSDSTDSTTTVQNEIEDSIYVEELGRTCYWDSEYECYYDKPTDSYFAFNDADQEWQYWFEGISSDYGDYGWMEFDYDECIWYIEVSDGNWEVLPDKYDASALWHMKLLGTGRYEDMESIYVASIDRTCYWDEEELGYVDEDSGCIFSYNDLVDPPIWQYWYDGISSDFGDYGAMEYDFDEECWYIETANGEWEKVPDTYDTSNCWHMDE